MLLEIKIVYGFFKIFITLLGNIKEFYSKNNHIPELFMIRISLFSAIQRKQQRNNNY